MPGACGARRRGGAPGTAGWGRAAELTVAGAVQASRTSWAHRSLGLSVALCRHPMLLPYAATRPHLTAPTRNSPHLPAPARTCPHLHPHTHTGPWTSWSAGCCWRRATARASGWSCAGCPASRCGRPGRVGVWGGPLGCAGAYVSQVGRGALQHGREPGVKI